MDGPPTLSTLPAEMHCAIAEAAEDKDILALRLTSRALSAACIDTFCSRFFDCRYHLCTRAGLQQLADITSQARLCTKLTMIQLISVEFDPDRKQLEDSASTIAQDIWETEHAKFISSGLEIALLEQILENIAGCKEAPIIAISDRRKKTNAQGKLNGFAGFSGLETLLGEEAVTHHIRRARSTPSMLRALTTASAQCAYPMAKLDLSDVNGMLDRSTFDLPDSTLERAWSKLSELQLGIYGIWNERHDASSPSFSGLSKLLKSATELKRFQITSVCAPGAACNMLGTSFDGTSLATVELVGLDGDKVQLKYFLRNQRATLRHLDLLHISLPDEADWKEIFSGLAESTILETIAFCSLRVHAPDIDRVAVIAATEDEYIPIMVKGARKVHEFLIELAHSCEFVDSQKFNGEEEADLESYEGLVGEEEDESAVDNGDSDSSDSEAGDEVEQEAEGDDDEEDA